MRKYILSCLVALALLGLSSPALAVDIRVLIGSENPTVTTKIEQGSYSLVDAGTNLKLTEIPSAALITLQNSGSVVEAKINGEVIGISSRGLLLQAMDEDGIFTFSSLKYRGSLQVMAGTAGLLPINLVDLEKYLYGVVGKEIGYAINAEALKAQAVVSRSYAYSCLNPANKYDLNQTISSQLYGGYTAETASGGQSVIKAVDATKGEVLYYKDPGSGKNMVVQAYYHASAGGHTEDIENVWPGAASVPLKGVDSKADAYALDFARASNQSWPQEQYSWQVNYSKAKMTELAKSYSGKDIGEYQEIRTLSNSASGRLTKVEIVGSKATVSAEKDSIRSLLGGLKSTLIQIGDSVGLWLKDSNGQLHKNDDAGSLAAIGDDGKTYAINGDNSSFYGIGASGKVKLDKKTTQEESILITGQGHGHGVGLSQWGARGMAEEGKNYQEILLHYFTDGKGNIYLGKLD